jgi:hypothetical protein
MGMTSLHSKSARAQKAFSSPTEAMGRTVMIKTYDSLGRKFWSKVNTRTNLGTESQIRTRPWRRQTSARLRAGNALLKADKTAFNEIVYRSDYRDD